MVTEQDVAAARASYLAEQHLYEQVGFTRQIGEEVWPRLFANGSGASRRDALELFKTALEIPDGGRYCEIGAGWGGSLLLVHRAAQTAGRRISLETVENIPQAQLREVLAITGARLHDGLSQEVHGQISDGIDLLLVDGWHSYSQVCSDINGYFPKVREGGTVMFHDFDKGTAGERHWGVVYAVLDKLTAYELVRPRFSSYVKVRKRS